MAINDYNSITPINGLGNVNSIDPVNDNNQRKNKKDNPTKKHKTIDETLDESKALQYDSEGDDDNSIDFRA